MAGILNYLRSKIVLPVYLSLFILSTPHISPSVYSNPFQERQLLEQRALEFQKDRIRLVKENAENFRKRKIKELMPESSEYLNLLFDSCREYDFKPEEMAATFDTESEWNTYAISPSGAAGIPQLMPQTAHDLGLRPIFKYNEFIENERRYSDGKITRNERDRFRNDYADELISLRDKRLDARFNPRKSIPAGANYYNELRKKYDNSQMASAAYNAGPYAVDKWMDNGWKGNYRTIPFDQTRRYVKNVNLKLEALM